MADDAPTVVAAPPPASGPNDGALWVAVIGTVGAASVLAATALTLAMLGRFMPLLAVLLAMPFMVGVVVLARRSAGDRPGLDRWAIAACGIALSFYAWNSTHAAAHVVADRGATATAATAAWIFHNGDVRITDGSSPSSGTTGTSANDPATERVAPGAFEATVPHAPAALMAVAIGLVGPDDVHHLTAAAGAVGLLSVQLALRRLLRRPALSLAGMAAVGVSMPLVFAGRDTSAGTLAMAATWGAIAVASSASPARLPMASAALTGVLVGGAAIFGGHPAPALLALAGALAGLLCAGAARRTRLAVVAGAGPLLLLTMADLLRFAGSEFARDTRVVVVAVAAVAAVWGAVELAIARRTRLPRVPTWAPAALAALAVIAAIALGVVTRVDRFVGPIPVAVAALGIGAIAAARRGLGVSELTGGLALGLTVGWVAEAQRHSDGIAARPTSAVLVPFVVPFTIGLAMVAIDRWWSTIRRPDGSRRSQTVVAAAAAVVTVAVVTSAGALTWPVRDAAQDDGLEVLLDTVCRTIGRESTIVVFGEPGLALPLRGECDAAVTVGDPAQVRTTLATAQAAIAATCARVYVLTTRQPDSPNIRDLVKPLADLDAASTTSVDLGAEPPSGLRSQSLSVRLGRIRLPETCTAGAADAG